MTSRTRLERPLWPPPRLREMAPHALGHNLANGIAAFLFAAVGAGAIILAVATAGGLDAREISAWYFASYVPSGILSILVCWLYRQPLTIGFSIPGLVLILPAMTTYSVPELIGAYFAAGALILVLAVTGLIRRASDALPTPIVMAMVAGVFLPFGVKLVTAFDGALGIAVPMVAAWLVATAMPAIGRALPPILAALIAGIAAVAATGSMGPTGSVSWSLAEPILRGPQFSAAAIVELAVPLAVTVIGIHNPQGFAILKTVGYRPPENAITLLCGVCTFPYGFLGTVPTVVTGPANAILNASGAVEWRYVGGIWFGLGILVYGLFSPVAVGLALAVPSAFIAVLAGLTMLPVIQQSFAAAFGGRFAFGATATFLVTISGIAIYGIGAAFWGLVIGYAVSRLVERGDFVAPAADGQPPADDR